MAGRNRDYKAEYAAAKRRAKSAGYQSEREYKAVRKALGIGRRDPIIPRTIANPTRVESAPAEARRISKVRRDNRRWSQKHSRKTSTEYNPRVTDAQAEAYHAAWVEPVDESGKQGRDVKRRVMKDYLVGYDIIDADEWAQIYG
jgi:hypothetical protein